MPLPPQLHPCRVRCTAAQRSSLTEAENPLSTRLPAVSVCSAAVAGDAEVALSAHTCWVVTAVLACIVRESWKVL